jgi:UDP-2,3-diacylglucosamine pyrophosphatase LpxH
MKRMGRPVDVVVISDVHLGTRGCRAEELLNYLKSIQPGMLILNGDIIDGWQFKKKYWPSKHMKVIKQIIGMAVKETEVFYITGNHDEMLRKFAGLRMGSLQIVNQLVLELGGKKTWFFHGDVFDVVMQHSPWLAKIGAIGYDSLISINVIVNRISRFFGKGHISLSRKIKGNVKTAVKFINDFEKTAAKLAAQKDYDAIVCGHIHQPEIKIIESEKGPVQYLNSGDWIENLTALEFYQGEWSMFEYKKDEFKDQEKLNGGSVPSFEKMRNKEVFKLMLRDFQ